MPRPKNPHPKVRLNIEMAQDLRSLIEKLQSDVCADSLTEVIRNSVKLYDFLVAERSKGNKIMISHDGKQSELRFPAIGL